MKDSLAELKDIDFEELDEGISQSWSVPSIPESGYSPGRPHIKVITANEFYDMTNSLQNQSYNSSLPNQQIRVKVKSPKLKREIQMVQQKTEMIDDTDDESLGFPEELRDW